MIPGQQITLNGCKLVSLIFTAALLAGISSCRAYATGGTRVPTAAAEIPTLMNSVTTIAPTPTRSPTLAPSPTASPTTFPEPQGCHKPPEDYTRLEINKQIISRRTLAMLEHAYSLYGGQIDIRGPALTQGHYTDEESLSFGTHAGGGVVDISVIDRSVWRVLYDEIEPLIAALRTAGFAAWLREFGELSPDSPIHIHAVAIGDAELSPSAQEQLTGTFGYFRGFNGLPQDSGLPIPDRHGGPLVCWWMVEMGYRDLREG